MVKVFLFCFFITTYKSGFTCYGCAFALMLAFHDVARTDWLTIMEAEGRREALDLATVESDNVASAVKKFWICFHVVTITQVKVKVKGKSIFFFIFLAKVFFAPVVECVNDLTSFYAHCFAIAESDYCILVCVKGKYALFDLIRTILWKDLKDYFLPVKLL